MESTTWALCGSTSVKSCSTIWPGKLLCRDFSICTFTSASRGKRTTEDVLSGSLAAAYGGFTGVLCMPNTKPAIDNVKTLDEIRARANGNIVGVDNTGCATLGREGKKITEIKSLKEHGALAITDDGSSIDRNLKGRKFPVICKMKQSWL